MEYTILLHHGYLAGPIIKRAHDEHQILPIRSIKALKIPQA